MRDEAQADLAQADLAQADLAQADLAQVPAEMERRGWRGKEIVRRGVSR